MNFDSSSPNNHRQRDASSSQAQVPTPHPVALDFDQQRLRILRCTARAMAGGAGGLRFKPGTRVWLDGLTPAKWVKLACALDAIGEAASWRARPAARGWASIR